LHITGEPDLASGILNRARSKSTDLYGEQKNSRLWNVIAWGTSIIVIAMTLVMLWGIMPGH
jgi:Mn2+/Fe2+ NRAMP family transporter